MKRVYEDISRRLQELGGPAISPEGAIGEAVAIVVSHGWLGRWDEFIDVKVLVDGSLALDCSYRIDSESAADKIWGMDELAGHAAQNIYRLLRSRRSGQ